MKIGKSTPPIILAEDPFDRVRYNLEFQQPSTKWCLTNDVSVPFVIEKDPVAVKDAKSMEERIGLRQFDVTEWIKYFTQRAQRQFSSFYRIDRTPLIGEYQDSSVSLDAKERASQALRFTPPAIVTKDEVAKQAIGLEPYKSKQYEWRKLSFWESLIHRLKGGEVRRD